jgi:recombination protein RecA
MAMLQRQSFVFLSPEQLLPPEGLSTGHSSLDQFLLWKGLPKGALSSFSGEWGQGTTSLWMQTAAPLTKNSKHVAYIAPADTALNPWGLKRLGVCLNRLFWISPPQNLKQKLWILQELCSLDLFEMIGCPLGGDFLKDHHLLKLKRLARRHKTAVVFLSRKPWTHSYLSLSLHLQENNLSVLRALHRPTPHVFERRELYAHTVPEFVSERKSLPG